MSAIILLELACEGTEGRSWFVITPPDGLNLHVLGPFDIDKAAEQTRARSLGSVSMGNMFPGSYDWPFMSDTCEKVQDSERDGTAIWRVPFIPASDCYLVGLIAHPSGGQLCFNYKHAKDVQVALCTSNDTPPDG